MKLVKVIDYERLWTGKDGKERPSISYRLTYTLGDSEKFVSIVPKFGDSSRDWYALDSLASVIVKGNKPDSK